MAYAMTKRGSLDNEITYEFICDQLVDMNAIEKRYRTIGSIAIVLQGESGGLEVYIAGSDKQWNSLSAIGGSSDSTGGLSIYICGQNEVNNGLPDISEPDDTTVYLVPAGNTSGNLFEEYIYVDGAWEKFGAASIDLSNYIQKTDIATQSTAGLVKVLDNGNVTFNENNQLVLTLAGTAVVKSGQSDHPISVTHQHEAAFYGLAKAAGQDMKNSNNAVGTYTTEAASAIRTMIGAGTYSKPVGGIPAADLASGVIPDTSIYALKANPEFTGSISLGRKTNTTVGNYSIAIGYNNEASNTNAVAYGAETTASGMNSFAEGASTIASDVCAHAEGSATTASGISSHAEGTSTVASGYQSHAEGIGTTASGYHSHAEGNSSSASANGAHAEGKDTVANATYAHAEGYTTTASGSQAHAEGGGTTASATNAHAEGGNSIASGVQAHAEGMNTIASGAQSHAEGLGGTFTFQNISYTSESKGVADHTEGYQCLTASTQPGNHAEGFQTQAIGGASHSEGNQTLASGSMSHAEGNNTQASGAMSHAEGLQTKALGDYSHVSGKYNVVDGYSDNVLWPSWAPGTNYSIGDRVYYIGTGKGYECEIANNDETFILANWRPVTELNYAEIIGNGTADARSNARTLDWFGNEYLNGDLYINCNDDSTGGSKVATEATVTALTARVAALEAQIASLTAALEALLPIPSEAVTDESGNSVTDEQGNYIVYDTPTT